MKITKMITRANSEFGILGFSRIHPMYMIFEISLTMSISMMVILVKNLRVVQTQANLILGINVGSIS